MRANECELGVGIGAPQYRVDRAAHIRNPGKWPILPKSGGNPGRALEDRPQCRREAVQIEVVDFSQGHRTHEFETLIGKSIADPSNSHASKGGGVAPLVWILRSRLA